MNYYPQQTISDFSNMALFEEIKLMSFYMDDIIENHSNYYKDGDCYMEREVKDISDYLGQLEKEWIKRSDDLLVHRYNNVNQFLN